MPPLRLGPMVRDGSVSKLHLYTLSNRVNATHFGKVFAAGRLGGDTAYSQLELAFNVKLRGLDHSRAGRSASVPLH
ncbi:hypothetical protein GCM10027535_17480 [Mycolicibacterium hippocampi]|uniref:Uncharacterized protein n=1 Tax=Mycolicibacterium hippocampi TaxID=659824 RepID=A0A7I9ZIY2_9MYCO|nr:hypothetical protein MHIP_10510 [Mycolicibacterium hippocampi]